MFSITLAVALAFALVLALALSGLGRHTRRLSLRLSSLRCTLDFPGFRGEEPVEFIHLHLSYQTKHSS